MARRRLKKRLRFLLFTQLSCSGCFSTTPFQSARVAEPGENIGFLSIQKTEPRDDADDEGWTMVEFGTRIPLGEGQVDLGLNGAILVFDPPPGSDRSGGGGLLFGAGVKFELIDDILSLELPARVTFAGAGTFHTTQFYPRAIVSLPVTDFLEVNLSATKFFFAAGAENTPWGYAAGLAIGKRGGAIIRPEIGVLDYPDGDDMIQFGIAYTPEFRTPQPQGAVDERTPH